MFAKLLPFQGTDNPCAPLISNPKISWFASTKIRTTFKKAIELKPDDPAAHYALGNA